MHSACGRIVSQGGYLVLTVAVRNQTAQSRGGVGVDAEWSRWVSKLTEVCYRPLTVFHLKVCTAFAKPGAKCAVSTGCERRPVSSTVELIGQVGVWGIIADVGASAGNALTVKRRNMRVVTAGVTRAPTTVGSGWASYRTTTL